VVAVLFDTFVVRTFVLTALTGLLDDWMWYPCTLPVTKERHASSALSVQDSTASLRNISLDTAILAVNDVETVEDVDTDAYFE